MADRQTRDLNQKEVPDTDQNMWDSAESMSRGSGSSGELGSSLGDLFADESADEIEETVEIEETLYDEETNLSDDIASGPKVSDEAQVPLDTQKVSDLVDTDEGKEVEEMKEPDEAASSATEGSSDKKIVDEAGSSPSIPLYDRKTSKTTKPRSSDLSEGQESKDKSQFGSGKGDGGVEIITVKSFHDYKSYGSEDGAVGIDKEYFDDNCSQEYFFLNIEDNRASRLRRPSIHTIRSAQTVTSSEEEMYTDLYDTAFIDFEVSRKRKLAKWEEVLEKLETERKNEVRKDAETGCQLGIASNADAANEDQLDEWLVTMEPEYKPKLLEKTSSDHLPPSPMLDEKESCHCLHEVFPQPSGFDFSTKPERLEGGIPITRSPVPRRYPSPEKLFLPKDYNTVTVKFILPKGQIYNRPYQRSTKMLHMKTSLARIFKIPVEMVSLQKDVTPLANKVVLESLGIEQCGCVEINLVSRDPIAYPIIYENALEEAPVATQVPDVINVTTHLPTGEYKELIVEIFNDPIDKPWLGGYRDTKTHLDYHHAFSQTPPLPTKPKMHRDTQTPKPPVTQYQNTPYTKGTQMSRGDYYVSTSGDKIIAARPYVPFDERADYLQKVITIQRYTRAWLVRKMMKTMSKASKDQATKKADLRKQRDLELKKILTGDSICNVFPCSREDFSILYNMVERWRHAEIEKISRLKLEAPKKAELCLVLEKEIKLLNAIEKHRIAVKMAKLEKKETDFMEKSAQPKTWVGAKGQVISMATLATQRAGELMDLYTELDAKPESHERRMNVLVSVKNMLKGLACENTKALDILHLIDREIEMLGHGMTGSQLEFLRRRLAKAFRDLMKVPDFNAEGSKHFSQETAYQQSLENMFRCTRCDRYAHRNNFVKTSRMNSIQHCISCAWLEAVGGSRLDLSLYRTIMRSLRREEKKLCCTSSIAFIMQEEDFYFLINNIWHGKSPISEFSYLPDLRLCRWNINVDWSPWNCILLSDTEMYAHKHLNKLEETYSPAFIADVKSKHQVALVRFKTIKDIKDL